MGPQDVALSLIGKVFPGGFVKNKVLEFIGEGVKNLPIEYRNGIDVMTTETTCLSSIWTTDDDEVKNYYAVRGRLNDYRAITPEKLAYYDAVVEIDLDKVRPVIAMPFHPANTYDLQEVIDNPEDVMREAETKANDLLKGKGRLDLVSKVKDGKIYVEQGIIAGCAGGTYDNIIEAASILRGRDIGTGKFTLSVYPSSTPYTPTL